LNIDEPGQSHGSSKVSTRNEESETFDENALEQSVAYQGKTRFSEEPTHAQIVSGRLRLVQEIVRGVVGIFLLAIIAGILWFSAVSSTTSNWSQVKDWLQIALPTMAGFFGFALGFYFSIIQIHDDRRL
jgi:hypothetical protein